MSHYEPKGDDGGGDRASVRSRSLPAPAVALLGGAVGSAVAIATLAYVILGSWRSIDLQPQQSYDEQLFINLAISLLSGHWLGKYEVRTLIKGIGYPVFLAFNNLTSMPVLLGEALLYAAAVLYLVVGICRLTGNSRMTLLCCYVCLLFNPAMSDFGMARVIRESFYTSAVLFLVGAVVWLMLVPGTPFSMLRRALWAGVWGGWVWLTREEGVWLLPAIAVLVVLGLLRAPVGTRRARIAGACSALLLAGGMVAATGLVNRVVYGRFVVNEIKDGDFEAALRALYKASYPDWSPYVPVPKAARMRIYAESPAFRQLQPFLDPPDAPSSWGTHCSVYRTSCGDIEAGWFFFAFREAAARIGVHDSPTHAAAFYRALAGEVETACALGRLRCAAWLPPLFTPMVAQQVATLPLHFLEAAKVLALMAPITPPSDARENQADVEDVELLNAPQPLYPLIVVLNGWYHRDKGSWFSIPRLHAARVVSFERHASPDLPAILSDQHAQAQRYTIKIACIARPCSVQVRADEGDLAEIALDPASLTSPSSVAIGPGTIGFDEVRYIATPKAGIRRAVLKAWPVLQSLYSAVIVAGAIALLINLVCSGRRRALTDAAIVALGFAVLAVSRIALLGLLDASSFPAAVYRYMSPAIPLALACALLSIRELWLRFHPAGSRPIRSRSIVPAGGDGAPTAS